jgi:hypothetical protein
MSPVTHLLLGWAVANAAKLEKRERLLVTVAGVLPDVDGLGLVAEVLTKGTSHELLWWTNYHHIFGHNLWLGLICALAAGVVSKRGALTAGLFLVSFHTHLLGDILGARGPDPDGPGPDTGIWTITYFWPWAREMVWSWPGQWKLNSWQNLVLTAALLVMTFRWAWQKGHSPLEFVSQRANDVFVETLRKRFPMRQ